MGEVSQMLLKSIEHHIQDAGKVLLRQDENTCTDKIASCQNLADAGVCASSKDAMVINCPKTCNFCDILEATVGKETIAKQEEAPVEEAPKKVHKSHKKKHIKKKAKKHHHKVAAQVHAAAPPPAPVVQTQTGHPVPVATVAQP